MAERPTDGQPAQRRSGVSSAEEITAALTASETEEAATEAVAAAQGRVARYPEHLLPIAGEEPDIAGRLARGRGEAAVREDYAAIAALRRRYERFSDLREELVADYSYNTARAYWGDLDDLWWWAAERGKDVFTLTEKDLTQYVALHRRRKYSENTIRRKMNTIRRFRTMLAEGEREEASVEGDRESRD